MGDLEIFGRRELDFPVWEVYGAFSNPDRLKNWWGPKGFSNTFHEFDLREGGTWRFTMHGPEAGHYENEVEFTVILPCERLEWNRISNPHFYMAIEFEDLGNGKSAVVFRMRFTDRKLYGTISKIAPEKNEENFDRLASELAKM